MQEQKDALEDIVMKHLGALRDELRATFPDLDVVLEMEMDRTSDWRNFQYTCYSWVEDPTVAGNSDAPPVFTEGVSYSYWD